MATVTASTTAVGKVSAPSVGGAESKCLCASARVVDVTPQDVKASYRRWAPIYDWMFGRPLQDGRDKLIAHVERLQPKRLLEIGVGTGLLLPRYPKSTQVVGIDISDEMLAIARRRVERAGLTNVDLRAGDCEHMNFADGEFDCVVIPYVLSVTPDPARLVHEAIRVCAPEGRIIVANHFNGSKAWALLERLYAPLAAKIGFRSDFSYEEHILAHPWTVESVETANWLGLSKVVVLIPPPAGAALT
ncbi:MAG: methyltransferase domain-containing protein [Casimicrobiaceae bacterium]|nr:methyltransferase domain-containing protein [Casimicrobiaceae bacterium]